MTGYVADLSWKSGARAIEKLDRLRSTMAMNVLIKRYTNVYVIFYNLYNSFFSKLSTMYLPALCFRPTIQIYCDLQYIKTVLMNILQFRRQSWHAHTYNPRDLHMTGYSNIHALFECLYIGRLFIITANQALISSITVSWSGCAVVLMLHTFLFLHSHLVLHREHSSCSTVSFASQTTSHRTWHSGNYGHMGIT